MGKLNRDKFKEDSKPRRRSGGSFSDWKSKGETAGFIHPRYGLWEKYSHGVFPSEENTDDGTKTRWRS